MSLGENIRKNRLALGLTQEALGEKLGMAAQTVSKWEREESLPDAALLPKLAEILGVSLDRLFDRTAGSFADAYAALKGWLLSLDGEARWKGALHLGQGMLAVLSGILENSDTRSWEGSWLEEGERDSGTALEQGFSLFSRRKAISFFSLFLPPREGWAAALEKDNALLWEALGKGEVRRALLAFYAMGEYMRMDKGYLDKQLEALGITEPEAVTEALMRLQVLRRESCWLDGRETELFSLYIHANLMQILLLGNAGPWGTVGFGVKEKADAE